MKKQIILIFFLFLFFSTLIFNVESKFAKATSDINYTFNKDKLYEKNENFTYESNNIRNQTLYTNVYNGTYSFENEIIGTNRTNIDFIDTYQGDTPSNIKIISQIDNHNKILDVYRNIGGEEFDIISTNLFNNQDYGTIEWWWQTTNISNARTYFYLTNTISENDIIRLYFRENKIKRHDGTNFYDLLAPVYNNIWYHMRVDFESTLGEYKGLNQYKWNCYINGKKYGSFNFNNNEKISELSIMLTITKCHTYFDAIGYSWNSYSIGLNRIPFYSNTTIQEVDAFKFAFDNSTFQLYPTGYDNPSGWTDIEVSGDRTNIIFHPHEGDTNNHVRMILTTPSETGLYRNFFLEKGRFEIIYEFTKLESDNSYYYFNLTSYDNTLIMSVRMYKYDSNTFRVDYNNGVSFEFLFDINYNYVIDNDKYHRFFFYLGQNILFKYYQAISFYDQMVLFNETYFPKIENKEGLNSVIIYNKGNPSIQHVIRIDTIRVYCNGSSYSDEIIHMNTDLTNCPYWDVDDYNWFLINISGTFSLWLNDYDYPNSISLYSKGTYNLTKTFNFYNESYYDYRFPNPYLSFIVDFSGNFNVYNISISGSVMVCGSEKINLVFTYENVNETNNYFYIDNDNRLQFYLEFTSNQSEYIQASFNIIDRNIIDYSISYLSYYTGYELPYFILIYSDLNYGYYEINKNPRTRTFLLPQQNIYIDYFNIKISDYFGGIYNHSTRESGFVSGYISYIKLIYIYDIETTLITITLINGIIPLIIILLPTASLKIVFGKTEKKIGNAVVIPSLIIMTIMCFVSQLIPLWLFSISLIIFAYLIIVNKKEK